MSNVENGLIISRCSTDSVTSANKRRSNMNLYRRGGRIVCRASEF